MSMTDPIADMLTRIRNAQAARHDEAPLPYSRLKEAVAGVMKEEGYIADFRVQGSGVTKTLTVALRYTEAGLPVVSGLTRVSRPGRRAYFGAGSIPRVLDGLGVCILSTSNGVLSDREARRQKVGGEVLCNIW
jgi:small subunit ribosomal protein S8